MAYPLKMNGRLDERATELGDVVREIVKRFEVANVAACNGPHADLTMQESRVVELLGESGGQMMRAVADYLGIAVNSVTSLADNLERKGLLRRVRSEADRRVVHVELTEAGHDASRSIAEVKQHFHREMLAALTDEEQAILLVLLRKVGGVSGEEAEPSHHRAGTPPQADAAAVDKASVDTAKPNKPKLNSAKVHAANTNAARSDTAKPSERKATGRRVGRGATGSK